MLFYVMAVSGISLILGFIFGADYKAILAEEREMKRIEEYYKQLRDSRRRNNAEVLKFWQTWEVEKDAE